MANENRDVYPIPNQGKNQIEKNDIDTTNEVDTKVIAQGEKAEVPGESMDEEVHFISIDDLVEMELDDNELAGGYLELDDLA